MAIRRPTRKLPRSRGYQRRRTPDILPDVQLDPVAFDEMVKNRGIRWCHQKSAICPNVDNIDNQQHDPNCRECENGHIYFGDVLVSGILSNNTLQRMYEVQGAWDVGEAVVTFSAYQDSKDGTPGAGDPIDVQHFDRLTAVDHEFRWQELIEFNPLGIQRTRYPILAIELLRTKDQIFQIDRDFVITSDKRLKWTKNGRRPKYDQSVSKGEPVSIVYAARPVFIVVQLLHEIRATRADNPMTGATTATRLPQQVLIRRDYLFRHPADQTGQTTTYTPRSGGNIIPS